MRASVELLSAHSHREGIDGERTTTRSGSVCSGGFARRGGFGERSAREEQVAGVLEVVSGEAQRSHDLLLLEPHAEQPAHTHAPHTTQAEPIRN
jgi:hypothetical protein